MNADIFIGIDPDSKGAVTIIYPGNSIEIFKVTSADFWEHLSAEFEAVASRAICYIEKPFWNPKNRNGSTFGKQMHIVGMFQGICTAFGIPVKLVSAQKWQKAILVKDMAWNGKGKQTKHDSRFTAQMLHPHYSFNVTDGQADSVCIAHYGMNRTKADSQMMFRDAGRGTGINMDRVKAVTRGYDDVPADQQERNLAVNLLYDNCDNRGGG